MMVLIVYLVEIVFKKILKFARKNQKFLIVLNYTVF